MQRFQLTIPGILMLALAACGGNSGTSVNNAESAAPVTARTDTGATSGANTAAVNQTGTSGSANNIDNTTNATEPAESGAAQNGATIDGRVADGYLQGATICMDTNENGSCDENEPQTVSGAGGVYSLTVPDDAAGKPIVADVPEEAIDEDTGEAIGKKLVFSTPGDKPSFVSPITTMVHQVLKNNPSLDTSDAEASVMETLGLPNGDTASLFTDYVAGSESENESSREKFRFIHQTARVVATMLDEIRENVETSAADNGFDLTGSDETRKAVNKLIHEQVRSMLPEISVAVAGRIEEIRITSEFSSTEADLTTAFDPDRITSDLDRVDDTVSIAEQIEMIKSEKTATETPMQELLTAGMYMLDIDCQQYDSDDGFEEQPADPVAVLLSDDGKPEHTTRNTDCFAYYTRVALDGRQLNIEDYYYNAATGVWEPEFISDQEQEIPDQFVLIDGQWTPAFGDDPLEITAFMDNGSAIIATDMGELVVQANTTALDDTPILHHLLKRGANRDMSSQVSKDVLFASDSDVYRLTIKRRQQQHILLNWYSYDDGSGIDYCAQYNNNCNVIDTHDVNGFIPVQSLVEIQAGSLDGMVITEIARENDYDYSPLDLKFSAKSINEDSLPTEGTVDWLKPEPLTETQPGEAVYPGDEIYTECDPDTVTADGSSLACGENFVPGGECGNLIDQSITENADALAIDADSILANVENEIGQLAKNPIPLTTLQKPEDDANALPCDYPDQDNQQLRSNDATDDSKRPDSNTDDHKLATSAWRVITVDGVEMIDIDIPLTIRHRIDLDNAASLLLIEDDGYLRRGVRLGQQSLEVDLSYSEAAFQTLRPIVEKYISQK